VTDARLRLIADAALRSKLSRLEVFLEVACGERDGVEKTLRLFAFFAEQECRLRVGFHPFSNDDKITARGLNNAMTFRVSSESALKIEFSLLRLIQF
jgi:hypothetical protein